MILQLLKSIICFVLHLFSPSKEHYWCGENDDQEAPSYTVTFLTEGSFHDGTRNLLPLQTKSFIEQIGGDPFGNFTYHHNMLLAHECDRIVEHIDKSEHAYYSKVFEDSTFEFSFVDIPFDELQNMIGGHRFQELEKAIHTAVGRPVPITRIRGRRMPPDASKHLAFHHDTNKHATLLIELNEGYTGGQIVYLTGDGPVVIERYLGTGVIHGSDIVHGVLSQGGSARYVLHVFSDMNNEDLVA